MKKKAQLFSLIRSDIKASQLICLFTGYEIDFDLYLADHSTLIFEMLDIDSSYHTDELYSMYFSLVNRGREIDLKNDPETLEKLTLQVYTYLVKYRELCAILEEESQVSAVL